MTNLFNTDTINQLATGTFYGDIFAVLGMHEENETKSIVIRTVQPQAKNVYIVRKDNRETFEAERVHPNGVFVCHTPFNTFFDYFLRIEMPNGSTYETEDAYRFLPVLGEMDLYLYNEGNHKNIYEKLGSHLISHQDVKGVVFAVWAPNAKRVSVVGNFNDWDGRRHVMRPRGSSGIWELFIPHLPEWSIYKYELIGANGELMPLKIDPFGNAFEMRPKTGTLVFNEKRYQWQDSKWMAQGRYKANALSEPISIYEVHAGSWRRKADEKNRWLTYRELAEQLPAYVKEEELNNIISIFKEYYKEHMLEHTKPYDGIIQMLDTLRKNGCKIGVVSNKFDDAVKGLCKNYFGNLVDIAIGEGYGIEKKPDPKGVIKAIKQLDSSCENSVYIGDSEVDIQTAQNAGLPCISVLWGFKDKNFLINNGAKNFAETPNDIIKIIEKNLFLS